MTYLICDKNFVGFLSAVYDNYYSSILAQSITSDPSEPTLLDESHLISEDVEKAKKVRDGIIKKGGTDFYEYVCNAYRSGDAKKEDIIFQYLKLFFKDGKKVLHYYDHPSVIAFNDIVMKVSHEVHRLSAFVRLQEMSNGVFYAYFASDNDILERIMKNLIPRFNTMKFIVHDYKRSKMAYWDGESLHYSVAPEKVEIVLSESEQVFQNIWKQYHENVSIRERENKKLQRAFLPKKYRHFMLEF